MPSLQQDSSQQQHKAVQDNRGLFYQHGLAGRKRISLNNSPSFGVHGRGVVPCSATGEVEMIVLVRIFPFLVRRPEEREGRSGGGAYPSCLKARAGYTLDRAMSAQRQHENLCKTSVTTKDGGRTFSTEIQDDGVPLRQGLKFVDPVLPLV
ncbi:solute carrier family 15, member 5 [Sarotherodon galilaeus]